MCSTDDWWGVAAGGGRSDRKTATPKSESNSTSRLMKCFGKFFHSFVKQQRVEKTRKFPAVSEITVLCWLRYRSILMIGGSTFSPGFRQFLSDTLRVVGALTDHWFWLCHTRMSSANRLSFCLTAEQCRTCHQSSKYCTSPVITASLIFLATLYIRDGGAAATERWTSQRLKRTGERRCHMWFYWRKCWTFNCWINHRDGLTPNSA